MRRAVTGPYLWLPNDDPPAAGLRPKREPAIGDPAPASGLLHVRETPGGRTLRHWPTEGHHPRSAVCPRHPCMPAAIEDRIVVTDALGTQVKIKSEVFRDHVGLHDANGHPPAGQVPWACREGPPSRRAWRSAAPEPELPVRDRLAVPSDHDQSGQVPLPPATQCERSSEWSQSVACRHAMPTLGATSACAAGRGYIPRRIATRSAASAHGVRSTASTANPDGTE